MVWVTVKVSSGQILLFPCKIFEAPTSTKSFEVCSPQKDTAYQVLKERSHHRTPRKPVYLNTGGSRAGDVDAGNPSTSADGVRLVRKAISGIRSDIQSSTLLSHRSDPLTSLAPA